nr:hypothetical protein [Corynebacterium glutamicum]
MSAAHLPRRALPSCGKPHCFR